MTSILLFIVVLPIVVNAAPPAIKKCVNGTPNNGICVCEFGYTGTMCHRKMHCDTLDRLPNGSCPVCSKGWAGTDCDRIDCGAHGKPNSDSTRCQCEPKYSGEICDRLERGVVLRSFNENFSKYGPLGVLAIFPLMLLVFMCNKISRRQWSRKVERHLETTVVKKDLDSKLVHKLLKRDST